MQLSITPNYSIPKMVQNRNLRNNVSFGNGTEVTVKCVQGSQQWINFNKVKELLGSAKSVFMQLKPLKDGSYTITASNTDNTIRQIFTYNKADELVKRQLYQYENGEVVEYMCAKYK